MLGVIANDIQKEYDLISKILIETIIELNLFSLDGSRVENINQFQFINIYMSNLLREIIDNIDNDIFLEIYEKNLKELQIIIGEHVNIENIIEEIERINEIFNDILKIYNESKNNLVNIKSRLDNSNEIQKMFMNEHYELEIEIKKYLALRQIYDHENIFNNILRIIGGLMIVSGVILWYIKIQRFIDNEYKRIKTIKTRRRKSLYNQ